MGCLHVKHIDKVRYVLVLAFLLLTGVASAKASEIGTRYLFLDARGDVTLATDGSGNAVQSSRYGPWGNLIRKSGKGGARPGFTGQKLDSATGLHYFNARYYDAALGRFLSPDPIRQFHSPYLYAFDSPLEYVDPTGEGGEFYYLGNPVADVARTNTPRVIFAGKAKFAGETDPFAGLGAYRMAYYFEAPVHIGNDTIAVPTRLSRHRFINVATAMRITYDDAHYFDMRSYMEWVMEQPSKSIVAQIEDHGVNLNVAFASRQEHFDTIEPFADQYLGCIDTGCQLHAVDGLVGGEISGMFNDKDIMYISTDVDVLSMGLGDGHELTLGGNDWQLNGEYSAPFTLEDWANFTLKPGDFVTDYHIVEPSYSPWYFSVPDKMMSRITVDQTMTAKRSPYYRNKLFPAMKRFDFGKPRSPRSRLGAWTLEGI